MRVIIEVGVTNSKGRLLSNILSQKFSCGRRSYSIRTSLFWGMEDISFLGYLVIMKFRGGLLCVFTAHLVQEL